MFELIGKRIKELRLSNDLLEEQVADYLGISKKKYLLIEKGINSVSYDTILKISQLFGVTAEDILHVLENTPNRDFRIDNEPDSFRKIFDMIDFFYVNKSLYMKITQKDIEEDFDAE